MYKSKLIAALRSMTNKELKWFEQYISSPFFNKNEKVLQLFSILKKYHPEYEEEKVQMEKIFPKIFPKEKLDEQKLRYVMTDLTKLAEDYLAYLEFDKNEVYKKHLLLSAYDNRNLEKYFSSTLDEVNNLQKKSPYRDVNFYFNQHLLEDDSYLHSLAQAQRAINTSLQEAVDNLDLYYLSSRLRYNCAILSRQDLLQEKYNNLFLNEILTFLSKTNLENIPSVSIYHGITMLYIAFEDEEHYRKLKILLDAYGNQFPPDELKDMFTHALTYCSRKINAGKINFLDEMLELYKSMIEKEIIFENGYISPTNFKNIVTLALRSGQLAWTENFIPEYKNRITPEFRDSTYAYNLANLHYFKKEFSKALKLMQTVELNDIYFHLDAKVLLLKTYYELDEAEPFYSLVDAFTNYLKRNKLISDVQRSVYLNFVRYAKKLMQLRLGSKFSPAELREEMKKLQGVANLQWLLEKMDELEQKSKR